MDLLRMGPPALAVQRREFSTAPTDGCTFKAALPPTTASSASSGDAAAHQMLRQLPPPPSWCSTMTAAAAFESTASPSASSSATPNWCYPSPVPQRSPHTRQCSSMSPPGRVRSQGIVSGVGSHVRCWPAGAPAPVEISVVAVPWSAPASPQANFVQAEWPSPLIPPVPSEIAARLDALEATRRPALCEPGQHAGLRQQEELQAEVHELHAALLVAEQLQNDREDDERTWSSELEEVRTEARRQRDAHASELDAAERFSKAVREESEDAVSVLRLRDHQRTASAEAETLRALAEAERMASRHETLEARVRQLLAGQAEQRESEEAEKHARDELERRLETSVASERKARGEAERRHLEVVGHLERSKLDHAKLQGDRDVERRSREKFVRRHEELESEHAQVVASKVDSHAREEELREALAAARRLQLSHDGERDARREAERSTQFRAEKLHRLHTAEVVAAKALRAALDDERSERREAERLHQTRLEQLRREHVTAVAAAKERAIGDGHYEMRAAEVLHLARAEQLRREHAAAIAAATAHEADLDDERSERREAERLHQAEAKKLRREHAAAVSAANAHEAALDDERRERREAERLHRAEAEQLRREHDNQQRAMDVSIDETETSTWSSTLYEDKCVDDESVSGAAHVSRLQSELAEERARRKELEVWLREVSIEVGALAGGLGDRHGDGDDMALFFERNKLSNDLIHIKSANDHRDEAYRSVQEALEVERDALILMRKELQAAKAERDDFAARFKLQRNRFSTRMTISAAQPAVQVDLDRLELPSQEEESELSSTDGTSESYSDEVGVERGVSMASERTSRADGNGAPPQRFVDLVGEQVDLVGVFHNG